MSRPAVDRRRPPPAGPRRPFSLPAFERRSLAGGVELLLAPLAGHGLTQLDLICPGGAGVESAAQAGLATLTASLLDEGTSSADAMEIARRVESIGGDLSTSADWDAAYLSASVPAAGAAAALELLAELARDAAFPEREVARLRRQRRAELRRRAAQPGFVAAVQLAAAIFGDGVYGHSLLGTDDSIAAVDRRLVVDFARRSITPAGASLLIVGELDSAALGQLAERLLEPWSDSAPAAAPSQPPPATAAPSAYRTWIIDRPDAGQTELRCGQVGLPRRHPDFAPLQVLNSILGGKFTSRLNLSLRERHGVTYGAHSRVSGRLGAGPIVLSTAVANAAAGLALGEMLAELERLRQEPVAYDELADARDYLLGIFPYTLQTLGGLARRLEILAVHSLPDDYHARYLERIEAVRADELQACARRHLRPDEVRAVAVGPAAELGRQLEPYGPLRVVAEGAALPAM